MNSLLLAAVLAARPPAGPSVALPWFTGASIAGAVRVVAPADAPRAVPGTSGPGIRPDRAVPIEDPVLRRERGMISFWIRPEWDGGDGRSHRLLRIGDPARNGLLVEKAATGMLRFVMASPRKVTAARADVSGWRAGEWHHVAVAWMDREGKPLGLPLWVDRVAVDGPVAADNDFLDPAAMQDRRVWLGDASSQAVLDELIFRDRLDAEGPPGQAAVVYRDYFRTAPYRRIAVDPDSSRVASDRRVVAGFQKQFGLLAGGDGRGMERVTDFAVRYGQWAEFDAKPCIRWTTSDPSVATVDANGLVTGRRVGRCRLTAEFRGMRASYALEVIPVERPDLDLVCVERLPRYRAEEVKNEPAPGDPVELVAWVCNYGYRPVPAGAVVRFELLPDGNGNFRLDPGERRATVQETALDAPLEPGERRDVRFRWRWPAGPVWVRVSLDPADRVEEICEANNARCELNTGRPLRFAYDEKVRRACHEERKINLVGSFSYFDWFHAEKARLDQLVRETVLPTTSPDGIQDAFRTDCFYALRHGKWEEEPWVVAEPFFDGGFPVNEPVNVMAIDAAIIHEFGHTCLALPDLYGYPMKADRVFLKDDAGSLFAGGPLMPVIDAHGTLPLSSANNVPCGVGYNSLMNFCHLWLHPAQAGQVQHFRGFRGSRFWGTQGRFIPNREHLLRVYDVEDRPLAGAAVYVYHVSQTEAQDAGTKYFADRPKFMGNTDAQGVFRFPGATDEDWDDPSTDTVDGAVPVWNPFGCVKSGSGSPPDTA